MLQVKSRVETMELEYQNNIDKAPVPSQSLYKQACSNDAGTIDNWSEIWLKNIRENKEYFGSFKDHSIGQLFGLFQYQSCIIAGSGPSLAYNIDQLKHKGNIPLISCLHNFHFMEDRDVQVDYYVSLDAGEITIEEVSEGGQKTEEEYWELTRSRKLICFIGTSPRLIQKWKGEIFLFNAPVPSKAYEEKVDQIEKFNCFVGNGGNVLGACLYIAKGFLGCSTTAFVGADFAFGYNKKFHGWDSKYDKNLGHVIKATDIFGNKVLTWQSYYNFKCWFDWVAQNVPGIYINCTEGGTFGAYNEGNINSVKQMPLSYFINMINMNEIIKDQINDPENAEKKVLF